MSVKIVDRLNKKLAFERLFVLVVEIHLENTYRSLHRRIVNVRVINLVLAPVWLMPTDYLK